jgi:hypothetical protein
MKNTKGPWTLFEADTPFAEWSGKFAVRAEQAPGGIAVTIGGLGEEEEANALLICEAPNLRKLAEEVAKGNDPFTKRMAIEIIQRLVQRLDSEEKSNV